MPNITPLPVPPTREDAETFAVRADAYLLALQAVFAPELNLLRSEFLTLASNSEDAKNAAEAAATLADAAASAGLLGYFVGVWSTLSGSLAKPASTYHSGKFWLLVTDLANVALSEPSGSNPDWMDAQLVRETGATFTGAVSGPSATFTNLTAPTATVNSLREAHQTITGTAPTITATASNNATWDLTGNSTPVVNLTDNTSLYLRISDGSAFSINWGSSGVVWVGDLPVLPTTGYAHVVLWRVAGTTYGVYVNDSAS